MGIKRFVLFVTLLGLASMVPGFRDFGPQAAGKPHPVVRFATRSDTTIPVREMPTRPPTPAVLGQIFVKPLKRLPNRVGSAGPEALDPVLQETFPNVVAPDTDSNFEGVDNVNFVLPPDTVGDIGPGHYVQMVNIAFAIYDRTGILLHGPVNNSTLWTGFGGPCETTNHGDPIVLYDHLDDRWMMSQFALPNFPSGPFYQCIAVSQTGDPTGSWYLYEFEISNTKLNDYPKFGVWPDGYYMAVNQFACNFVRCRWGGQGVVAFERDQMLQGLPARMVYFDLRSVDSDLGGMLPADLDGPVPPAGAANPFVMVEDDAWGPWPDRLQVWNFLVDWINPANSTFTFDRFINTAPFDSNLCGYSRNCIPQPGGRAVDTISDRLMNRLQYRNFGTHQSMVVNHSVDVGDFNDHAGVRWYELRNSGSGWGIHQQGTHAPDSDHRWMASAAMNGAGDIALGYSVSSESVYPSIRYTGRLAGDPLGDMTQGEGTMIAGSGYQTHSSGRWGDYSSMSVDPVDDCTFWYTQEYYQFAGNAPWQTRIGSFKFADCAPVVNDPNDAPVVDTEILDQATDEDALFILGVSGNFDDPDNQPQALSYSVTGPGWLGIDTSTGVLSGTPVNDDVGISFVTVTASDGQDSVFDTFSMTVNNTNDAPVLVTPIADQIAAVDASFNLDVSGNFDDVDAVDVLTFSAELDGGGALPGWLSLNSNSGVFSGTPASTDVGAVSVAVTASDGPESVSDTFDITVSDAAPNPVVGGCSPNSGGTNQRLTVTVSGTDFQDGAAADFGERIAVQGVTFVSTTVLDVRIKIHRRATSGDRDVTVTNPDGGSGTLAACFSVN